MWYVLRDSPCNDSRSVLEHHCDNVIKFCMYNTAVMTVQISLIKNSTAHLCGKDILADGDPSPEIRMLTDCVPFSTDSGDTAQFSSREVGEDGKETPALTIT